MLRRFPHEYQMDAKDCGPVCLKIIAKYYGKYYSLQYLRDLCGITREGVSFLDISYAAEKIGLLHVSTRVNISLISDYLIKLMKFSVTFFENKLVGDILQRAYDHERIRGFVMNNSLGMVFSTITFLIFSVIFLIYNSIIFFIFIADSILYVAWDNVFEKQRRMLLDDNLYVIYYGYQ